MSLDRSCAAARALLAAHRRVPALRSWIAEIMSRFMFMRGAVLADPSIKLIVSERGYERTKIVETMRLLGISEDRLVKHGTDVTLRVKELLVVDWRGAATKRLEDGAFLPPREGLRLAREAFVPDPVPVEERTQILWISRNEAGVDGRRDVTNEEAVLRALYEELDDLKKANLLRANYTLMIFTGNAGMTRAARHWRAPHDTVLRAAWQAHRRRSTERSRTSRARGW